MNEKIIIMWIVCSSMLFGASLFAIVEPMVNDKLTDYLAQSYTLEEDCNLDDLYKTSLCLREKLAFTYNYNKTNVGKELTEEELAVVGGVCSHYTEWYKTRLLALGYYVETPQIFMNKTTAHTFAIASDEDYYCILDQMEVHCYALKI